MTHCIFGISNQTILDNFLVHGFHNLTGGFYTFIAAGKSSLITSHDTWHELSSGASTNVLCPQR